MKEPKTGSASYGIDFGPINKNPWWQWHRFPLIPVFDWCEGNKWNNPGFSFSWLMFRFWSLDSFAFCVEFHVEEIGVFVRVQLPYLNCYVWLLLFPESWMHKLSRKPKGLFDP